MKINYDYPIDLILNHQLEDGLYHWSDRESEDSGWNDFDHFSFFENKEIILVEFKKFGVQLDNRMNGYTLSVGEAGLMIDIKKI